jgi:hypothetical protein
MIEWHCNFSLSHLFITEAQSSPPQTVGKNSKKETLFMSLFSLSLIACGSMGGVPHRRLRKIYASISMTVSHCICLNHVSVYFTLIHFIMHFSFLHLPAPLASFAAWPERHHRYTSSQHGYAGSYIPCYSNYLTGPAFGTSASTYTAASSGAAGQCCAVCSTAGTYYSYGSSPLSVTGTNNLLRAC